MICLIGSLLKYPARIKPQLGYLVSNNSNDDCKYSSISVLFAVGVWYKAVATIVEEPLGNLHGLILTHNTSHSFSFDISGITFAT